MKQPCRRNHKKIQMPKVSQVFQPPAVWVFPVQVLMPLRWTLPLPPYNCNLMKSELEPLSWALPKFWPTEIVIDNKWLLIQTTKFLGDLLQSVIQTGQRKSPSEISIYSLINLFITFLFFEFAKWRKRILIHIRLWRLNRLNLSVSST